MLFSLLISIPLTATSASDKPVDPNRILILFTGHEQIPFQQEVFQGFIDEQYQLLFDQSELFTKEVYIHRLDAFRSEPEYLPQKIESIYKNYPKLPATIIAEGNFALRVAQGLSSKQPNEINIFAVNTSMAALPGFSKGELFDKEATLDLIPELFPNIKELVVLAPGSRRVEVEDLWDLNFADQFDLTLLDESLSFDETLSRLKQLPADRVILWLGRGTGSVSEDGLPIQLTKQIVELDVAPLISMQSSTLKAGGLGGYMTPSRELGQKIAQLVYGQSEGFEPPQKRYILDYNELERWKADTSNLKGPISIINEPLSIFTERQVQTYIGLLLLMAALLSALFAWWIWHQLTLRNRQLSKIESLDRQLHLALTTSKLALIEENVNHQTGQWIIEPPNENVAPLVGEARLNATEPGYRNQITDALAQIGAVVEYPLFIEALNRTKWVRNSTIAEHTNAKGELIRIQLSQDVTDIKEKELALAESVKRTEKVLQQLNDVSEYGDIGLFHSDLIKGVVTANDVFRSLYDLPKDQYPTITQEDISTRIAADSGEDQLKNQLHNWQSNNFQKIQRELLLPSGERRYLELNARPEVKEDVLQGFSGAVINRTDDVLLRHQLEVTLSERSQAVKRLEETLQKQKQMFAVIGHELRTPAAALNMMLEADDAAITESFGDIRSTSQHLLAVLDDLRSVVEPELIQERALSNARPIEIIERSLTPLKTMLDNKQIRCSVKSNDMAGHQFNLDQRGIRQVLTNMVKNAVVHGQGSTIQVQVDVMAPISANEETMHQLRISVEDDGRGIPTSQYESIFEPFERGDTEADGTGLGLSICREIIQANGGTLNVKESVALGGACFIVDIPVEPRQSATPDETASMVSLEGLSVLMAEDNLMLRKLSENLLQKLGANPVLVENGQLALDLFNEQKWDLIITDIFMPEMNGYELVEAIRATGSGVKVLGVTAATVGNERDLLLKAGADVVMGKPITSDSLQNALLQLQLRV
ncbi:hybrid sensor histidine kinase/response regulator [Marinobacterium sp. xm-d-579]|uniref:hybrid sensor histidine kinase/response regulator n=1 Tax=Marinobacterium sp. xm-d-579 TaxID=2497734 RepID=UPI001569F065|nr:hybrid sensor histidine kinase/response regulator [Marinobacterium sp. xm-d-579]